MRDQAEELRSMVLKSVNKNAIAGGETPHTVAVIGGKGGVGTTTVAVNLSVALAQFGHRVVIVDAHLGRSDVAALCRLRERYGICDVLTARRDIHEVLEPGPVGIHVLPGTWAPEETNEISAFSHKRFAQRIRTLGPYADWVIFDTGSQIQSLTIALCEIADRALIVTNPDTLSVMDAYATIKTLVHQCIAPSICSIVNQATDGDVSREAHERIARSCERFLQLQLNSTCALPLDEHVAEAAEIGVPVMTKSPTCSAARAIERLAAKLMAEITASTKEINRHQAIA